ncbi:MAG: NAAT family transporter [Ignavibacteriales bacterium]|nr:NAAT family transporter [Ignavibacteriales bacterium]
MDRIFQFSLLAFTSLFTMVTPFGVIPLFSTLTAEMSSGEVRKIALKGVATAFTIIVIFAFAGNFIFDFFHISINGLKIVGGVLFFMSGYDMLNAKIKSTKEEEGNHSEFMNDFAITPLGIPMICGPGTITVTIVLFSDARNLTEKAILFSVVIVVLLITFLMLVSSRKILSVLGHSGNKVFMRIMGLIVMMIAVELMFGGLTPLVREMFLVK